MVIGELEYDANQLDKDVVAVDQIRIVIKTFKEKLFTEIFPGHTEVPKTLIYAKDDSHAENIVKIVREEFAKGNEFAQKITYKTTGMKTDDLIASFRNSYNPRIAVTVDMIATGTDIKPLEIVLFLRTIKSRSYFEQMKGRGVRVIIVTSFEQFIKDHKDEITALQILYSKPYKSRLRFEQIKELANIIEKPPYLLRVDRLWDAYAALEKSKVRGASTQKILADLVMLIRLALHQRNELKPRTDEVNANFSEWIVEQETNYKKFSQEQLHWLKMIKDHIVGSLNIEKEDFDSVPFKPEGGLGKAYQLFGEDLWSIMDELNEVLAA